MPKAKRQIELHAFVAEDMARNTVAAIEVLYPSLHVAFSDTAARHGYWFIATDGTRDQFEKAHELGAQVTYRNRRENGKEN